jgi:hypothetical protein
MAGNADFLRAALDLGFLISVRVTCRAADRDGLRDALDAADVQTAAAKSTNDFRNAVDARIAAVGDSLTRCCIVERVICATDEHDSRVDDATLCHWSIVVAVCTRH